MDTFDREAGPQRPAPVDMVQPAGGGNQQRPPAKDRPNQTSEIALPSGIQWFATLESGQDEANRTGKPILLVSAAPHCAGVSGIW